MSNGVSERAMLFSRIRKGGAWYGAARTAALTVLAMIAFAANSLLCRLALGAREIDAASFTSIRLASGALTLWLIVRWSNAHAARQPLDRLASAMLFAYAITFSFAYLTLTAGMGALILFGAVQVTMLAAALHGGERFSLASWSGFALAVSGLVYLVSPGLAAPPLLGAALMAVAGIAWGVYSLRGRGNGDPLRATAANFLYAVPPALLVNLLFATGVKLSGAGALLAIASGAVASGIGYVIWYAALRGLTATSAATAQLSVPVIAAFGGVVLLAETVTLRLILSSAAILGGIALVLMQRARPSNHSGR